MTASSTLTMLALMAVIACGKPAQQHTPTATGTSTPKQGVPDSPPAASRTMPSVTLSKSGSVWLVSAKLKSASDHRSMGQQLGKAVKRAFHGYEALLDAYLSLITGDERTYKRFLARAAQIAAALPAHHAAEIEGFASVFSARESRWRDARLSHGEILFLNLLGDVARSTACSALALHGSATATGTPLAGRNLDWPNPMGILSRLHMVMTIASPGGVVTLVGFLGHFGAISGMNDRGLFGAILDSGTGAPITFSGRRSYFFDLRHALETKATTSALAKYMTSPERLYTYNHLIFAVDPKGGLVVENVVSGSGTRAVRRANSRLNKGIAWGRKDSVAAVNSFLLSGNPDNHTGSRHNTRRLAQFQTLLSTQKRFGEADLKQIMMYRRGKKPARGDIMNRMTLHTIIVDPTRRRMLLATDPTRSKSPGFQTITIPTRSP